MGYECGVLRYMNGSMQYFVTVCNTAFQLLLEKLLNSIAINPYFFKKIAGLIILSGLQ